MRLSQRLPGEMADSLPGINDERRPYIAVPAVDTTELSDMRTCLAL